MKKYIIIGVVLAILIFGGFIWNDKESKDETMTPKHIRCDAHLANVANYLDEATCVYTTSDYKCALTRGSIKDSIIDIFYKDGSVRLVSQKNVLDVKEFHYLNWGKQTVTLYGCTNQKIVDIEIYNDNKEKVATKSVTIR